MSVLELIQLEQQLTAAKAEIARLKEENHLRKKFIEDRENRVSHLTELVNKTQEELEITKTALLQANKFRAEMGIEIKQLQTCLDVAVEGLESIKNRGTGNGGAVVTTTSTLREIAKSALERIKQIRGEEKILNVQK